MERQIQKVLQPRFQVAKPSVWINIGLSDVLFETQFVTLWNEHVAGFKQVRKAREDPEMEWKLRLSKKKRQRAEAGEADTAEERRAQVLEAYKDAKKRRKDAYFRSHNRIKVPVIEARRQDGPRKGKKRLSAAERRKQKRERAKQDKQKK